MGFVFGLFHGGGGRVVHDATTPLVMSVAWV
jgi:hypothetical protein